MAPPTGDQIAADALRYTGHPYVYGVWDCSSFVNHVLGQDLGLTLPGGVRRFRGPPPHGPVVLGYASWGGAVTVASPQRGDLAVWPGDGPNGHIGIVLGADQMISALDPAQGTAVTPITGYGPPGVQVEYRRVTGSAAGGLPAPGQLGAPSGLAGPAFALLLVAGMAAAMVGAAALLGIGVVLLGQWGLSKAGQQQGG